MSGWTDWRPIGGDVRGGSDGWEDIRPIGGDIGGCRDDVGFGVINRELDL